MAAGEGGLADVAIRRLQGLPEFERTVELQQAIWEFADIDAVPSRLVMVASHIGGIVLGAFEDEADANTMVGFSLSLPGRKADGGAFLQSHMTGVLPGLQGRHIGRSLKLAQRQEALEAGYELIEWTFDPLEIRNSFFNLRRLGVIIRRYEPNFYGITQSKLHGAIPTDRLVAEWHLNSPRVVRLLEQGELDERPIDRAIAVPAEAWRLRNSDPERAADLQTKVREKMQKAFAAGLTIYDYRSTDDGGEFLLGR